MDKILPGIGNFLAARLWTVAMILMVGSLLLVSWWVYPPTTQMRVSSWVYNPKTGEATITRIVNARDGEAIWARWAHVIYLSDGSRCADSDTRFYFREPQVENIPVRDSLRRCLDVNDPDKVIVLSWFPYLFNWIPLRPIVLVIPSGASIPRLPEDPTIALPEAR